MKTITFSPSWSNSGITITYIKRRKVLQISGWYASCVGIQGGEMTLKEFFETLGISEKEVIREIKRPAIKVGGDNGS